MSTNGARDVVSIRKGVVALGSSVFPSLNRPFPIAVMGFLFFFALQFRAEFIVCLDTNKPD